MFGNPENGAYIVNPEARLNVTNGSDGRACHLALEPRDQQKGLPTEIASRILNEIVPMNTRRGKPHSLVTYLSCAEQETQEYRNVTISTATIECKRKVPETEPLLSFGALPKLRDRGSLRVDSP